MSISPTRTYVAHCDGIEGGYTSEPFVLPDSLPNVTTVVLSYYRKFLPKGSYIVDIESIESHNALLGIKSEELIYEDLDANIDPKALVTMPEDDIDILDEEYDDEEDEIVEDILYDDETDDYDDWIDEVDHVED